MSNYSSELHLPLLEVIKYFKTKYKFAKALGVTHQNITQLVKRKSPIPARFVLKIEKLTNGEITRNFMRPDLYPKGI